MRFLLIFVLTVLMSLCVFAQVSTFNQYNNTFVSINPAFIADVDKNQVSLVGRSQWPDNYLGSKTGEFSANRFFPKINSSFGISSAYRMNNRNFYESFNNGIQFGYRVLFLRDYYICLGTGISHEKLMIDVNNYQQYYFPKFQFTPGISNIQYATKLKGNIGVSFNTADPINKQYVGLSIKNISMDFFNDNSQIDQAYSLSIHGMKRFIVSRNSALMNFINYERVSSLSNGNNILMNAYSYVFIQSNYFFNRMGIIGIGYKYFSNNYGFINYRIGYVSKSRFIIGYSFDTLPYIKHDKIWFNSSHEIALKYNFTP